MKITLPAPAKINLYLDVLGKRPDGYHNIKSVMQTVDLCDEITVEMLTPTPGLQSIQISCSEAALPCDARNLAHRAAVAFFNGCNIYDFTCRIDIQKNIPMAAGLAGGSTDAAAVLRGLNALSGHPLDTDALCSLGAAIGADVPFCIRGGTLYTEQIGDVMVPCYPMPAAYIVIALGGRGVSTPTAYRMLDDRYGCDLDRDFADVSALTGALHRKSLSEISSSLYNVFEDVILPVHGDARRAKEMLLKYGALGALMSGSGPAVFGVFDDEAAAQSAAHRLRETIDRVFVCTASTLCFIDPALESLRAYSKSARSFGGAIGHPPESAYAVG